MAQFTPKKLDKNAINGGNRFNKGDGFSEEAFNDPIEAILYLQENGGSGSGVDQALVDQVNANTEEIGSLQRDNSRQQQSIDANSDSIYLLEEKDKAILANDDGILDEAIYKGVTNSSINLSMDEQKSAREWLGAVGKTDYASASKAGLFRATSANGIWINEKTGDGSLVVAQENGIKPRTGNKHIIAPSNLDLAVKIAITGLKTVNGVDTLGNQIPIETNAEKTSALTWLGVDDLPDLLTLTNEQKAKWKDWLQAILS